MEMTGEQLVPLSQADTWKALNDPDVLKDCIPGCESIERTGDNQYAVTLTAKVGPVSATFNGRVQLSDIVPLTSYTISGEGKGGAAGFAKGAAAVALADSEGGTLLSYEVNAHVGGKLAQLGSRLIDGFAKKMADGFFDNFQAAVEPAPEPAEGAAEVAATGKQPGWFRRVIGRR